MRISAALLVLALASPVFAQRAGQGDDESVALVAAGRDALREGAFDRAAAALDQALALNPRRIEGYVLRAAVHAARREYAAAIALLRKAEALAPGDDGVQTALGSYLVLAGDAATGVPILTRVVARRPLRYAAQRALAEHYYATGQWGPAIAAFEAYFVGRPPALVDEDARYYVVLGDAYLRDHQPARALALFRKVLEERSDLRARLGVVWALAARDCRQARAEIRALPAVAQALPDVILLDGRCALALRELDAAERQADAYVRAAPPRQVAEGYGLRATVAEQRGDLLAARRALAAARDHAPAARGWAVRLAAVLRRTGDARGAVAELERIGAADEAAWWCELGEALLALGDAAVAADRIAPFAATHPREVAVRRVLGAAQLAAERYDDACATLDDDAVLAGPAAKRMLARALAMRAARLLGAGDAAGAAPLLVRATSLDEAPELWRNLGVVELALGNPLAALAALDRAQSRTVDRAAMAMIDLLTARARSEAGDVAGARPSYQRALDGATASDAVEVALDWAASELAGGDPMQAVAVLEAVAPRTPTRGAVLPAALIARHRAALTAVRHASAIAQLRAGSAGRAVELLRAALATADAGDAALAVRCDLALAQVAAGDAAAAHAALRAVAGAACPYPAPAMAILDAYVDGLEPAKARASIARLRAARVTSEVARLRDAAIAGVAFEAASAAYRDGELAKARGLLAAVRGTRDELTYDVAVLDVAAGKLELAIAQLERLALRMPDALVALGIAHERRGAPVPALDAWQRALRAGAKLPYLPAWIEGKARFFRGAP